MRKTLQGVDTRVFFEEEGPWYHTLNKSGTVWRTMATCAVLRPQESNLPGSRAFFTEMVDVIALLKKQQLWGAVGGIRKLQKIHSLHKGKGQVGPLVDNTWVWYTDPRQFSALEDDQEVWLALQEETYDDERESEDIS